MQFQFYFPKGYETRDLILLNKTAARAFHRWWNLLSRVLLCGLGAVTLLGGILTLTAAGGTHEMLSASLFPMILGAAWLVLGLENFRLSAWLSRRLQIRNAGGVTVTLDDGGVTEATQNKGSTRYEYSAFTAVFRRGTTYVLFLDRKHALLLPERVLTRGDPNALGSFLHDRLQMPVRTV